MHHEVTRGLLQLMTYAVTVEVEGLRKLLDEEATKHGEEIESYRTMYRDCQREIKSLTAR